VDIALDGQLIPVSIDTSFADLIVATDRCDARNPESGCYNIRSPYRISVHAPVLYVLEPSIDVHKATTKYLPNETFDTHLGAGQVLGNLSSLSVNLAGLELNNATTGRWYLTTRINRSITTPALIDWAMRDEFQNGSFAGTLGLGLRSVSLAWLQHRRLPLMDTLMTQNKLINPSISLQLPRHGDPERDLGKITFGAIEDSQESSNVAFRDVAAFSRYVGLLRIYSALFYL
jgi:hypothetical protein